MIVVSDTSPITNLIKISRLELLRDLYVTVVIPPAVRREVDFIEENRRVLAGTEWIQTVPLTRPNILESMPEGLDKGEAEAIALSLELEADLILIDETDGRALRPKKV